MCLEKSFQRWCNSFHSGGLGWMWLEFNPPLLSPALKCYLVTKLHCVIDNSLRIAATPPPPLNKGKMEKIKNSCSSRSSGMRNVPKKLGSKQLRKSHLRCKQSRRHFSVNFTMCLSVSHFTQWVPPTEITRNDRTGSQWKAVVYFLAKRVTSHNTISDNIRRRWVRLHAGYYR